MSEKLLLFTQQHNKYTLPFSGLLGNVPQGSCMCIAMAIILASGVRADPVDVRYQIVKWPTIKHNKI